MNRKHARRILGDLKKVSELRTRHRTRRVDFRGSQRPDEFARYGRRTRWGSRWKSQNRKNVHLPPYVEEPLNSKKVIKSFVPELRSRVFRVSGFLCSMYIYYEHSMYVSHTYSCMGMLQFVKVGFCASDIPLYDFICFVCVGSIVIPCREDVLRVMFGLWTGCG